MNTILAVLIIILELSFKIPLAILAHIISLISKNKREPPTLYQRIFSISVRTLLLYMPLLPYREIVKQKNEQLERRSLYWIKKLDACNEKDEWEGYLIADNAEQAEIGTNADMIILYIHGGAFVSGTALVMLDMFIDWIETWKLKHDVNTQVLSLKYRLAPEYPFPAARDNVLACYDWLVTKKNISPSKIVFAGDSSGGNLAVISALYLINNPRKFSIDPPAALILLSPFVSLLTTAQSYTYNLTYDILDSTWLSRCVNGYIGDTNLHPSSPLISPLFEDKLSGLPKVWACVGSYEIFLDDIKAFIEKLKQNNVTAELVIEENNTHDYASKMLPSRDGGYENSIRQIGNFLYG